MPLPDPHLHETEQDYVSRCIGVVVGDGTVENTPTGRAQGAAMCFRNFRDAQKPKKQAPMPDPNETEADFMDRCVSAGVAEGDTQAEVTQECQMMWDMCQQMEMGNGGGMGQMGRAYSLLTIKSFNEEQRIISGIATTPQTDLQEDIVEPRGADFKLPIPFLYQHDSRQPIGHVRKANVTDQGIEVEVQMVKVDEPGKLKDRLDEAWQSIKHGLIRGLSIGFKDLESEPIKGSNWGRRIKKWSWLELSAVTIAANQAASITMIKQADKKLRAKAANWSCGAARDLPINESAAWDGPAAQASMFDAGMDTARRGHLAYDSSAPDLKGSYKLPFARVSNGRLEALASGIRAAASRLPQTDIPTDVQSSARSVIDHYESKMSGKSPGVTGKNGTPAGASAVKPIKIKPKEKPMAKQTNTERIANLEATRAANVAAMAKLSEKVSDEGRTKDATEQQEFDDLAASVEGVDRELSDCRRLEKMNASAAIPIDGTTQKAGSESRNAIPIAKVSSPVPPGIGFIRILRCKAYAHKHQQDATLVARQYYPNNPEIEMAIKTAVAPGDTTTSTWATELVYAQNLTSEFIEFLTPMTVIGNIPGLTRVPFNVRVPKETSVISAQWVGEGQSKPVAKGSFDTVTLRWAKVACIMGFTEELARFSNPSIEMLVRNNLAKGIAKYLDEQFLDPSVTEVTNVSPAAITNGANNDPASGIDQAAVLSDIRQAFAHLQASNIPITNCVWVMEPTLATGISMILTPLGQPAFANITPSGGTLYGLPVIVSNNAPSGQVTLIHAPSVFLADDGGIAVDLSREASVQMDDNPTAGDYQLVSAFQQNLVFVRAERFITWKRARDEAVYYITAAAYGGTATV